MNPNVLKEVDEVDPDLMKTIQIPKNLHYLSARLPQANYTPLKTKSIDRFKFLLTLPGYKNPQISPKQGRDKSPDLTKKQPVHYRSNSKKSYPDAERAMQLPMIKAKAKQPRQNSHYQRKYQRALQEKNPSRASLASKSPDRSRDLVYRRR